MTRLKIQPYDRVVNSLIVKTPRMISGGLHRITDILDNHILHLRVKWHILGVLHIIEAAIFINVIPTLDI